MAALPGKTVALGNPPASDNQINPKLLADWMTEYEALVGSNGIAYINGTLASLEARSGVSGGEYALVVNTGSEGGVYEYQTSAWVKVAEIPSIFTESLAADEAAESAEAAAQDAATAASALAAVTAAMVAAGAPIFADTGDGIAGTSDGDVFLVAYDGGFILYDNDGGSAVEVGRTYPITLTTLTQLDAITTLIAGQYVAIRQAHNGEPETFLTVPDGTYTANGTTVIDLTGLALQAVSTRTEFAAPADLLADTRGAAQFATDDQINAGNPTRFRAGEFAYEQALSTATDHHRTTAGGVKVYVLMGEDNCYNLSAFGTAGDGVTDDTATILGALDAAIANDVKIFGAGTYKVSDTIHLNSDADLSRATFIVDSSFSDVVILTSAAEAGVVILTDLDIEYPSVINNRVLGVIPTAGSIGIKIWGCRNCKFVFNDLYGFEENLQLYSEDNSTFTAYNTLTFNRLFAGSKININLKIDGNGWVNECEFFGGQFAQYSGDKAGFDAVNVKITKLTSGGNNPPNGHTFFGCSMEGSFHRTIQYDIDNGVISYFSCNMWVGCRFEAAEFFEFDELSLHDFFLNCREFGQATFINNQVPNNISPRMMRFTNDAAPIVGVTGSRVSQEVARFIPSNSGGAMAIATGTKTQTNGGITGNGNYQLFSSNSTLEYPVVDVSFAGGLPKILFGSGSTAPTTEVQGFGSQIRVGATALTPKTDNTTDVGAPALRFENVYGAIMHPGDGSTIWTSGSGSPEGVVLASVGSLYTRTDGGAGTTLYVKESGTGNTGWVAK